MFKRQKSLHLRKRKLKNLKLTSNRRSIKLLKMDASKDIKPDLKKVENQDIMKDCSLEKFKELKREGALKEMKLRSKSNIKMRRNKSMTSHKSFEFYHHSSLLISS